VVEVIPHILVAVAVVLVRLDRIYLVLVLVPLVVMVAMESRMLIAPDQMFTTVVVEEAVVRLVMVLVVKVVEVMGRLVGMVRQVQRIQVAVVEEHIGTHLAHLVVLAVQA
tara:strand:+ start:33 stop:362 length:330 start_codon:yes stop_codon:yes gene_type:complete